MVANSFELVKKLWNVIQFWEINRKKLTQKKLPCIFVQETMMFKLGSVWNKRVYKQPLYIVSCPDLCPHHFPPFLFRHYHYNVGVCFLNLWFVGLATENHSPVKTVNTIIYENLRSLAKIWAEFVIYQTRLLRFR